MDLLVHEGVPSALLGGGSIPIHGVDLRIGHDIAHEIGDDHLVGGDHDGLILIDFHGSLGVGHECGHIGTQEVLSFTEPHHKWRIMACADHDIRLSAVGGQNGERTFKHPCETAHGLEQVRPAFLLDDFVGNLAEQLGCDFGIGLRGEMVAFGLQVETQLGGVFDDAVMDDGDLAVTGGMRVRIDVIRHAVGGPTGVADAYGGQRHRIAFDVFHQIGETTGLLTYFHVAHVGRGQRHPGRIITAVFQTLQSLKAYFQGFAARGLDVSCISYDSTHRYLAYRLMVSSAKRTASFSRTFAI